MKKFVLILACLMFCFALSAQTDTLSVVTPVVKVDSAYLGLNIFDIMPSRSEGGAADVEINQPDSVRTAVERRIASNRIEEIQGYRIRIFFSNAQNAREASQSAQNRFEENYPEHRTYRTYSMPNFKVTVGDFRTKSEALKLLDEVKRDFPSSFIVREAINLCD